MGAGLSVSKNSTKEIIDIITDIFISNYSSCSASLIAKQSIKFGTVAGDFNISNVNMDIKNTITAECIQTSENDSKILNDISQKLKQFSESKTSGLILGAQVSSSVNITNLVNNVSNSINMENIKKSLSESMTVQEIGADVVGGSVNITGINMSTATDLILKNITEDKNTMDAINSLSTEIEQTSISSITGIDPTISLIVCIIVIVIGLIISSISALQSGFADRALEVGIKQYNMRE